MKQIFLILIIGLLITGCAQRKTVQPEAQQPGAQQKAVQQSQTKGSEESNKMASPQSAKVESKEIAARTSEKFDDIHFDFDKYNLRQDAKPVLKSVADYLAENTAQKILVEGYCDERGTSEYNLALGEKRAKATGDYLVSLGVTKERLDTISYGKEKPLCTEHNEVCWAKNRRAHFVLTEKSR